LDVAGGVFEQHVSIEEHVRIWGCWRISRRN